MSKAFIKSSTKLFVFLIIISFIGDVMRRVSFVFDFQFKRYTTASKILFLFFSFLFVLYYRKTYFKNQLVIRKKVMYIILILSALFLINSFILYSGSNPLEYFYGNVEYFGKYLFLPIIVFLFLHLRAKPSSVKTVLKVFETVFYINLFAIVIGWIFNIEVFKTYSGERFGYKGIYSMSGQTSLYFILMMFFYIHSLIVNGFNRNVLGKLFLILVCSFLIGTKRIYLFIPALLIYYLFFLKGYKTNITLKIGLPLLIVASVMVLSIKEELLSTIQKLHAIYLNNGFISSVTSYRNDLLLDIYAHRIEGKWKVWNVLFGGLDFSIGRSQMGFIDLFLFFGLFGIIMYGFLYKPLLNFKFSNHFYWFFIISIFVIVFLADAFVLDTNVPILFLLLCFYFYAYEQERAGNI